MSMILVLCIFKQRKPNKRTVRYCSQLNYQPCQWTKSDPLIMYKCVKQWSLELSSVSCDWSREEFVHTQNVQCESYFICFYLFLYQLDQYQRLVQDMKKTIQLYGGDIIIVI